MRKTNLAIIVTVAAAGLTGAGCAITKPKSDPQAEAIQVLEGRIGTLEGAAEQVQRNDYWALRDAYKAIIGEEADAKLTSEQIVDAIETSIAGQTDIKKGAVDYQSMVGRHGFDAEATAKGFIKTNIIGKVTDQTDKEAVRKTLAEFAEATGATVQAYKDGSEFYLLSKALGVELTVDIKDGKFCVRDEHYGSAASLKSRLSEANFAALGEKSELGRKVAAAQGIEKISYIIQQVAQGHYAKPEEGTAALDSAVKQYLTTEDGKKAELGIQVNIPRLNQNAEFGLNMAAVYATGAITPKQAAEALVGRTNASEDTVRALIAKGLLVPGSTAVAQALDKEDCTVSLYRAE